MTKEGESFGRRIVPDKTMKGVIRVGDRILENPVKGAQIPAGILDDLKSLAIEAFAGEFEDSMGQSHLDEALKLLKRKYPKEQPQEVWRRDLAVLLGRGKSVRDIVDSLVKANRDLMTSIKLNSVTPEGEDTARETLARKIKEYWPSAEQRG